MKIQIESTDMVTKIGNVQCRLWEGTTEDGTPCKVFVNRIAVHNDRNQEAFERELQSQLPPPRLVPLAHIL